MPVSYQLADLLVPPTADQIKSDALAVLKTAGFPTTSWSPTGEFRATLEFEASTLEDLGATIKNIAAGGTLALAEGGWLDLLAADWFGESRKLGQVTLGTVTLNESAGSPQSWADGDLVIVSTANPAIVFRNVGAVTLAALGSASVTLQAESPGAAYVVDGSNLTIGTPVPGVALSVSSGTGWITQAGTDDELDVDFAARLTLKWAAWRQLVETGVVTGPADLYKLVALGASAEINRVRVQEDPLAVPPNPAVTIVVAGTAGSPSTTALNAANTTVQANRPIGVNVLVKKANNRTVTIRGSYKVKSAYAATTATAIDSILKSWFQGFAVKIRPGDEALAGLGIGDAVPVSQVVEIIMAQPGVTDVTLTDASNNPLALGTYIDGTPASDDVAVYATTLTAVLI